MIGLRTKKGKSMRTKEDDLGLLRCFFRLMLGIIFLSAGIWKCFILTPSGHVAMFFMNKIKPEFNFTDIMPNGLLLAVGFGIPLIELGIGALIFFGYHIRFALYVLATLLLLVLVGHLLKEPLFSPLNHIFLRALIASFIWILPARTDKWSLDYWLSRKLPQ